MSAPTEREVVLRERAEKCEGCAERPVTHVVGCNGGTARVCGECGTNVLVMAGAVGDQAMLYRLSPQERVS